MEANELIKAVQDIPLGESGAGLYDALGVKPYVEALEQFILSCGTPMTVAIQGDWGTGKTSMMRLIEHDIKSKVHSIWFNTWQYSQFAMADSLPLSFLSAIAERVEPEEGEGSKLSSAIKGIKSIFGSKVGHTVVKAAINAASGGVGGELYEGMVGGKSGKQEVAEVDLISMLEKLKSNFAIACASKCKEMDKERIVIFVDDLDRIQPARAVELLETLKMFVDVEHCVFVLALDYAVVKRGLSEKFGVSEKDLDGRSFFDKIIQLPFTMPTASYKLDEYLNNLLEQVGFTTHKDRIDTYKGILLTSIGANPRSIKRLVNIVTLMNIVFRKQEQSADVDIEIISDVAQREILLFSFVCLQTAYEQLYSEIRRNFNAATLKKLCSDKEYSNESSEIYKAASTIPGFPGNKERIIQFMEVFYSVIDNNNDGDISEDELSAMRCMMNNLSITAVESQQPQFDTGSSFDDDIITKTCQKAKDDFLKKTEVLLDDYNVRASRGIESGTRMFNFWTEEINFRIILTPHSKEKNNKLKEQKIDLDIYLSDVDFDGKSQKKNRELCDNFMSHVRSHGSWNIYNQCTSKEPEGGIQLTIDRAMPSPELAVQIADHLVVGYKHFSEIVGKWNNK